MRVLITAQVFPPEIHPTAVMVGELATRLSSAGHHVAVACGYPHHPGGRVLGGYRKRLFLRESGAGVLVIRGWHYTSQSRSLLVRGAVMVSQALGTAAAALGTGRQDVIISYGPPLVGPILSAFVARLRRARLVTVIYDIYPDVAVESGKVRNWVIIGAARIAERIMYCLSDRILVLSEGFRRTMIEKGVPRAKLEVVPVWLDPNEIVPLSRTNAWRSEQGIGADRFVVLYAGTMGIISGAEVLADAAARVQDQRDILFLVVGDGDGRVALERDAARRGLKNLSFLPFQDRSRLAEVQSAADVSVVTLAPGRGRTSVPSKVVAYMAAGRPVVASVDADSDTARCLESSGAGLVTSPADGSALAAAIVRLKTESELREAMGRKARDAFEREFTRDAVLERYSQILTSVRGGGR